MNHLIGVSDIFEDLEKIGRYLPDLVNGFMMMMGMYIFALAFGFGLGLIVAIARHYGGRISSRIATAFIEFMRGTPLVAQILAVTILPYAINIWLEAQGLPPFDVSWRVTILDVYGIQRTILNTRILLCMITLGLNSGAYQAEFFRGSLSSLAAGQTLAAQSIGMTKRQEIRHIALPQGLRRAIPSWANEAVYLPKYITVAYFVGVPELFGAAKLVATRTYEALLVYGLIAIVFLVLISAISFLLDYLYKRIRIPGL